MVEAGIFFEPQHFLLAELRIGVRQMGSGVGGSSRVVVCYTPEQRGIRGAYLYEFLRHV